MSRRTGKLLTALMATAVLGAMAAPASAVVDIIDNPGALSTDGVAGTSEYRYVVDLPGNPTSLTRNDAASLSARVLTNSTETDGGTAASPGGNVELGVADTPAQLISWNANTLPVVTLTGKLGAADVTLRSLTAADWFAGGNSTAYGNSDLANEWFDDLLNHYGLGAQSPANKALVFNAFVAANGFFRLSDPNVSYVSRDADLDTSASTVRVGLAGTVQGNSLDSPDMSTIAEAAVNAYFDGLAAQANLLPEPQRTIALAGIAIERANTLAAIPDELAASEVVIATYTGLAGDVILYGFDYTASGLATDDNTRSYDANFEVTFDVPAGGPGGEVIPEPMTAGLMGLALAGLGVKAFGRRRRA